MTKAAEKAKARFWLLQIVSFGSVGIAFLAAAMIGGKIAPGLPEAFGYALLILAVILFFLAPNALRRHWAGKDGKP